MEKGVFQQPMKTQIFISFLKQLAITNKFAYLINKSTHMYAIKTPKFHNFRSIILQEKCDGDKSNVQNDFVQKAKRIIQMHSEMKAHVFKSL